jgi:hypothetical protein
VTSAFSKSAIRTQEIGAAELAAVEVGALEDRIALSGRGSPRYR